MEIKINFFCIFLNLVSHSFQKGKEDSAIYFSKTNKISDNIEP